MKKFFVGLLTLCLCFCALSFTACEETAAPSTPENPPAETPQPEEETEEVEELERTVTTEFAISAFFPSLLTTEYYGNRLQSETYMSLLDRFGHNFEYGYNEQGVLETFTWQDHEALYPLSPDDPDSDSFFVELEKNENGKFTGTNLSLTVEVELHENGAIKKRSIGEPEDYAICAEFDEQGRRISDYLAYADNSYALICQYAYEGDSVYSNSCSVTVIDDGEESSLGGTITRENGLLSTVSLENSEFTHFEISYLPNGRFASCIGTTFTGNNHALTYTYNNAGEISQVIEKVYPDVAWQDTYTYNDKGLCTSAEYVEYKSDGSISSKRIVSYEYDNNDALYRKIITNYDANGNVLSRVIYDGNGNIIAPEAPQTTVTTEFAITAFFPSLLTTEYFGNQLQRETYIIPFEGGGICFEYGYNEQGILTTFAYDEISHFYVNKNEGEGSEHILFSIEQSENGKFTGTDSNARIEIEIDESGLIKKRELTLDYSNGYDTIGAEFDEQGRRISDYFTEYSSSGVSSSIICQYSYEEDSVYSNSCTFTQIADGEEISVDIITTRENNLLTSVYVEIDEVHFSFEYAQNGSLTRSVTTYYNGEVITEKNTMDYVYNEAGLVSQAVERTYNENDQLTYEYFYTYNEKGLNTHYEYTQYNSNGSVKYKYTSEYEYDDNHKKIKSTNKRYDYILNALVITQSQIVEYDDEGYVSSTTYYNTDGSYRIQVEEYATIENSPFGHKTKETTTRYDSNGKLSQIEVTEYKTVVNESGGWSSYVTKETETNYNTDGGVEYSKVIENEYNADNKISKSTETFYAADDFVTSKEIREYTYDENGKEIKRKVTDYGANCVLQSITESEYVIHANTRYTVKETNKKYSNGIVSEIIIETWDYHDNWRSEHHTIHKTFYLSDGNIDEEEITEYIYNDGQTDRLVKEIKTNIYYDYTEESYYKRICKREENSEQVCTLEKTTDYRSDGSLISTSTVERDTNGNTLIYSSISYDENGTIIREAVSNYLECYSKEISYWENGEIQSKINAAIDSSGNRLTCVEEYFSGDGVIEHKYEFEYVYTNTGERLTASQTLTSYTNGNIEYILTKTYEYDSDGDVLVCKCVHRNGNGNIIEEWEE